QPAFLEEVARAKAAAGTAPANTVVSPPSEPARVEPTITVEPPLAAVDRLSEPMAPAARSRPARYPGLNAAPVALVIVAAGLALPGLLARDRVQALLPPAEPSSAMQAAAEVPGADLKVTLAPMRTGDSLIVKGDIVNAAAISRRVPRLRLSLVDGNRVNL